MVRRFGWRSLSALFVRRMGDKRGFTMIELLIVIAILGVLTVLGITSFGTSQLKSRDARRKADLLNITKALEAYYNDHGEYPTGTGNTGIAGQTWSNPFTDPDNPTDGALYINVLPTDPSGYNYYYDSSDGTYFQLYAYLENEQDGELTKDVNDVVMVYSGTDCVIGTCNYGIASTNTYPTTGHTLVTE